MSSSLLRSGTSRAKLFCSSLSRSFSSFQIGPLPSLSHRASPGNESASKGNLTGLPKPNASEFGNLYGLRPLSDPIDKLGTDSNKFNLPNYNALGLDTLSLARAGNGLGSSRVWAASGPMLLGVRGAYADTLGRTGHKRVMSTVASTTNETKSYSLRPLSPHLPIYQPQLSSTLSIFNRISGAILAAVILLFYMIYMKLGLVSLTYDSFYQFLFYSSYSKLNLLVLEISGLALTYHLYMGIRHLLHLL